MWGILKLKAKLYFLFHSTSLSPLVRRENREGFVAFLSKAFVPVRIFSKLYLCKETILATAFHKEASLPPMQFF
jgi:hypothetical protein